MNLSVEAEEGRIDPLIGREKELERTIQVLCRRRKNNPLYVGEPGVGKTAIAEGLALRSTRSKVPEPLKGAVIYSLDMGALLAGTKFRGQFEERLKARAQGAAEAAGRDPLHRRDPHHRRRRRDQRRDRWTPRTCSSRRWPSGKLRCIGSTTYQEYKACFERDRALARRFQKIEVGEPTVEETVSILKGLKSRYEEHHDVTYDEDAIRAAAELVGQVHQRPPPARQGDRRHRRGRRRRPARGRREAAPTG